MSNDGDDRHYGSKVLVLDSKRSQRFAQLDAVDSAAWGQWYRSLERSPDVARGWALAYGQLPEQAREDLLHVITSDAASRSNVSLEHVFGPLLAVERSERLATFIASQLAECGGLQFFQPTAVLRGQLPGGYTVAVAFGPMYAQYFQSVTCTFSRVKGLGAIDHAGWLLEDQAPSPGDIAMGSKLSSWSYEPLIDELAASIVLHERQYQQLPERASFLRLLFAQSVLRLSPEPCPHKPQQPDSQAVG